MTTDNTSPHLNGDTSHTASDIMKNPAEAAGVAPAPPLLSSPHIQDEGVATLLNNMPGLVGAIDTAIKDTAGKPFPFMLMVFTPGIALHASNLNDKAGLNAMVRELVGTLQDPDVPGDEAVIQPAGDGGGEPAAG